MRKGKLFTLFLLLIGLVLFSVACSSGPNAEECGEAGKLYGV